MKNSNYNEFENKYKEVIREISKKGPDNKDYSVISSFYYEIQNLRNQSLITNDEFLSTRNWFSDSMSTTETLQGHVCMKPYGYNGDFEIIDKIYCKRVSTVERYKKWDILFHNLDASQAVRNRKEYFINILNQLKPNSKILNLACGPCRDILEYSINNKKYLEFYNIDIDSKAIEYSKELVKDVSSLSCKFQNVNIFKFIPDQKYDLIWSAGLFDYFDDYKFQKLLERFINFIKPEGKIIIGNFSPINNSKTFMEYGNWFLNHRDEEKLLTLANKFKHLSPIIDFEPLKVNLFLKLNWC
jgi:extracellular factor (EF) 3-hydroxypalmitic acid methyl ester biosynthesis protein